MFLRVLGFVVLALALFALYKGAQLVLNNQQHKGIQRLAAAISALWVGVPLGLMLAEAQMQFDAVDPEGWIAWFFLALLPVVLFWLIIWILKGFRKPS